MIELYLGQRDEKSSPLFSVAENDGLLGYCPWMAFDASDEPEWRQNLAFQRPKRRYFAEISAFAT